MMKRILAMLVTVVMVLTMMPVPARTVHADEVRHDHDGWTEWTSDDSLPADPGSYYLTKNVTLNSTWHIKNKGIYKLCLNGHSITAAFDGECIYYNSGITLNLYDCVGTGIITHASHNKGGAVSFISLDSEKIAVFNMYGGTIKGNSADNGGGVSAVSQDEVFNMYGGTITGNTANEGGGGVSCLSGATFNMYGGTITGNTAKKQGGGVSLGTGSTIGIAGSSVIRDNTSDNKADNIYLYDKIIEIIDALSMPEGVDGPQIGVGMDDSPGVFTSGLNGKLPAGKSVSDVFFSDDPVYFVGETDDHEAELVKRDLYTVTFVDGQGKTLKVEDVGEGLAATAPADPKRTGYTFKGWDKDFSNITENMTVTAQWEKNPDPEPDPEVKVSGTLLVKMLAKGKKNLVLSWSKVKGAEGYDIFFSRCSPNEKATTCKKIKTIKGNKTFTWTKKKLKKKSPYKTIVKAYITKDGKKTYVRTSPMAHAFTSGGTKRFTNAKSITLKKTKVSLKTGKTSKIKATVKKLQKGKKLMPSGHAPKLRYLSENKKIATVSKSGKITAKGKGSCKVYVIAVNGVSKMVTVTVK